MHTLCNRLTVPEIAHYRRTIAGETVTIAYATRAPLMSLWTGVRIVRNGHASTETHSGPHTTPEGAIAALTASVPAEAV